MNLTQKFKKADKYTRYSIYIIILFSIIVLSLTSIYHVSGDGCWHMLSSKFIAQSQKFPLFEPLGRDEPFWSPPLYHILVAAVYSVFNSFDNNAANFAIKFVSPVFGILTLIFSFLVIKKLANSKIAFYSAIFLAFVPIFIDYSVLSYVESTMTFFVVLSIYFLINGKIALSGISLGLSILAKYNGIFIIPVLLFILYNTNSPNKFKLGEFAGLKIGGQKSKISKPTIFNKKYENKKLFLKKSLILIALALLIASPWLIRNWALLGNPVWPFVNFIFHGFEPNSYSQANWHNLARPDLYISTYLGIFGVPDGNYNVFSFIKIPNFSLLAGIWLIGTIIFFLPLIIGIFKSKKRGDKSNNNLNWILLIWIIPYLLLFIVYAANVGTLISRIIIPIFPALAIFWAYGFDYFKSKNYGKFFSIIIALIAIGLVSSEYVKTNIAADSWNKYNPDFDWIESNTNLNSIFLVNGQCIPYNIERTALYVADGNLNKADYAWISQNFALDRRSILSDNDLKLIQSQSSNVVYSSRETGTTIYKIKGKFE